MTGDAIIDTTERMLAAAVAADWDEVARLNAVRDDLMKRCDAATLAPLLPKLAADTQRMLSLAQRARTASRDALGRIRRGRRAADVYEAAGA